MPLINTNLDKIIADALDKFLEGLLEQVKGWVEDDNLDIDFTVLWDRAFNWLTTDGIADIIKITPSADIEGSASEVVRAYIAQFMTDKNVREATEIFGSLISEPFVSLFESYATGDDVDGKEFASAFHGLSILVTLPEFVAKLLHGSVVGTVIGNFGDVFKSMYWNMGLGFLGWQTLAPLLSTGLQPNLERHYNRKFSNKRFTLQDLIYLYNAGEVTASSVIKAGRDEGWRLSDIQTVMDLSYHTVTRSDMQMLYQRGVMTKNDIIQELARSSTNPKYIPAIVQEIINSAISDEKLPSLSTLRKAFKEGYYSESELSTLLGKLGYGTEAINLEIALLKSDMIATQRELTLSQIREAFRVGTITITELTYYLHELGYSSSHTNFIIETWQAAKLPKILQLNKGTIVQALKAGVINEVEARIKLAAIGYRITDQNIIIRTALQTSSGVGHTLSVSTLNKAYVIGALSRDEYVNRLKVLQISNADIQIYLAINDYTRDIQLNENAIRDAYLYEAIDKGRASALLSELGYDNNEISIQITTWDNQRSEFGVKISPANLLLFRRQMVIDDNQLRAYLTAFGFSNADINLYVQSANKAFPRTLQQNDIEELFYSNVIDTNKAKELLEKTGLSLVDADLLIKGWTALLGSSLPQPSTSQYISAYRRGVINESELHTKLNALGYGGDAIEFYIRYANEVQTDEVKELTKSDILSLYNKQIIMYADALERLTKLGYSVDDAELLIRAKLPDIEDTVYHAQFINGTISPDELIRVLLAEGYRIEEIEAYLDMMLELIGA